MGLQKYLYASSGKDFNKHSSEVLGGLAFV
jgi:hypothetical protein